MDTNRSSTSNFDQTPPGFPTPHTVNDAEQSFYHPRRYPIGRAITGAGYVPHYPPPSAVPPPQMPVPSVLTPGSQPLGFPAPRPDLFFRRHTANMSVTRSAARPPSPPAPAIPPFPPAQYFNTTLPSSPINRSRTAPPPIPPKPPYPQAQASLPPKVPPYPQSFTPHPPHPPLAQPSPTQIPSGPAFPTPNLPTKVQLAQVPGVPQAQPGQASNPNQPPLAEEDELALALAISASESGKQQQIRTQEDEDLAKALAMSMVFAESQNTFTRFQATTQDTSNAEAGPSVHTGGSNGIPTSPPYSRSPFSSATVPPNRADKSGSTPTPTISITTTFHDESHSNRVENEVDELLEPVQVQEDTSPADGPPSYTEAISAPAGEASDHPSASSSVDDVSLPPLLPLPNPSTVSLHTTRPGSASTSPSPSFSTDTHPISRPKTADGTRADEAHLVLKVDVTPGPKTTTSDLSPETQSPTHSGSRYIDAAFLRGVSIGFTCPPISAAMTPLQGPFPNVILLPYGRCPPLHLQAPNWRHLLILMARLSTTRIEPTLEAIAAAKSTLKLRTVIQFVKVSQSEADWRTIIWLTIDHPVPPSTTSWKYTNGDVNTLPWSYTLSPLPILLSDGADGLLSKYYTIPSTASTPYPTLPINFPDMAMYLHAVLEESRRAMHDSSSGVRRLAKMIDVCYPETTFREGDGSEGSRVTGLFRRVIGIGNRNRREGRGNEDTYDMVTPFVLDDE